MPFALLHGGNVWLHQLQVFWISSICTRAGVALAACKHLDTDTNTRADTQRLPHSFSHSLWPVKFPWFCLQWVLIEQVVSECDKLRRDPAENGSGSQTEREQAGNLGLSPICRYLTAPHVLINTIYKQIVAFTNVNDLNSGITKMKYSL